MALIPFVVVGFSHVDTVTFFSAGYDGGFFHSGFGGVISAIAIMGWACQGTTMGPVGVVPITKNPKRTVPLGILIGCVVVSAVYGLMSYVAAGVLPYDQIAGENLSVPASAIMSPVLFAFFVIGGGVCATIPKKYPEQFAKRSIKCPVWLFNAGSVFGGLCALVIAITLFMDLTAKDAIVATCVVIIPMIFSAIALKTKSVDAKILAQRKEEIVKAALSADE